MNGRRKRNTLVATLFLARARAQCVSRQSTRESHATLDEDGAFESKISKLFHKTIANILKSFFFRAISRC